MLEHAGPGRRSVPKSEALFATQLAGREGVHALKAAGVPIMTALFLISLARLTLLPGEFSTRTSRFGMASPFCTNAGAVLWKREACARTRGTLVAKRRAANIAMRLIA